MLLKKLVVDPEKTLGNTLIVTEVKPLTDFGKSKKVIGTTLEIVMAERGFDKEIVKLPKVIIEKSQTLQEILDKLENDENAYITLINPEIKLWEIFKDNKTGYTITAEDIELINK